MPIDLFSFVGLYDRTLVSLAHLLDKGEAFATGRGEPAEAMLGWRLADDMHPLRFQATVVIDFAQNWTARVAGLPVGARLDQSVDLAGLRTAIAATREYLAGLDSATFAGRDDEPLTVRLTDNVEPTMPAGRWLTGFATTNIQFHLSMVYAILRMKGAPIGKIDLFAGQL